MLNNPTKIPMGFPSCQYYLLLLIICVVSSCHVILVAFANSDSLSSLQPSYDSCHDNERSALLRFKHSFIIDCRTSTSRDHPSPSPYPKLNSWGKESGDCCKWEGVKCNKNTGHVIGIDLSNSCLYGTFPVNSSLFDLPHLEKLNLGFNLFNYSEIPHSLGQLHKLTSLNLSNSFFSGQIPLDISKLSSLSILDLSDNFDSLGDRSLLELRDPSLEKLIGNLTSLNELYLDQVDISSTVPTLFMNLTSLRVISLSFCNLYGEFPSSIFHLPKLQVMVLSGNFDLVGLLPEFYPNSPLRKLRLDVTGFHGDLPSSIGYLGSLEELTLWHCHFVGMIPSTIGNLTILTHLYLDFNDFTGYIPSSITNLTHLQHLGISYLKFKDRDLMNWLPKLDKLTRLSLRGFDLGNEISSSLANLTRITDLDLSDNQLKGSIPSWLANRTQLNRLNLEDNELQGPIPKWVSQLVNLASVELGNNGGLFGDFNTFLNLKKLTVVGLSGVKLMFSSTLSRNSSLAKFNILDLSSCNLTGFPEFLRDQDELKSLSLSGNNIQGNIPQWFVRTTKESLLFLDLSRNSLTSFEQSLVDLPWDFLKVFDLTSNRLQGLLPNPSSLMLSYQVPNNLLTGVISENICNADSLKVLDLSDNKISGPIPQCLDKKLAQSLLVLNLRGNNLNGSIPRTFDKACKLKMINLSENQLRGNLPRSLANCKMLEVLDIGRNSIDDTFPSWLGSLSNLQVLVLRHNFFHGVISSPRNGFVFPSMRIIDLSCNFYTGDFPYGYLQHWDLMKMSKDDQHRSSSSGDTVTINYRISNTPYARGIAYKYSITITNKGNERLYLKILDVFRVVDLSSNKFTGRIPDSIGNLRGLEALNLSNNNLEDGIPSSLANMKGLESLDLSQNMLSGGIPHELVQITYLEVFNVSHNNLVGPIPQGAQFNTFDNSSFDGNLGLCGSPLSRKCGNVDEGQGLQPSSVRDNEREDEPEWVDWMIRLLGYASGFVVSFILAKLYITDKNHDWFVETFGKTKSNRRIKRAQK